MLLTSISTTGPGSLAIKADNTPPLDNVVESGYITQNFVNEDGYVDLSTNEKFQRVSDYYTVNRLGDFTTVGWNTAIMDVIFENKTAIAPEVFHKNTDEDNLLKVNGQTTAYWATDGTHGGYYSLISQKVAVNSYIYLFYIYISIFFKFNHSYLRILIAIIFLNLLYNK